MKKLEDKLAALEKELSKAKKKTTEPSSAARKKFNDDLESVKEKQREEDLANMNSSSENMRALQGEVRKVIDRSQLDAKKKTKALKGVLGNY